jgi:hypothetical membrane protein
MMRSARVQTFIDRYPFVGPIFWMLSLQYFITQALVAQAWIPPFGYSLANNTISDLGNTACTNNVESYLVCSPWHDLMNTAFVVLGLSMIVGSILIYHEFKASRRNLVGFGAMALAGVGTIMVGLIPENLNLPLHLIGAGLPFLIGNAGLVILGSSLDLPRPLAVYTLLSGLIPMGALVLFLAHINLGLGHGGMERVVAYPQTIWLIVFGIYMSNNHYRRLVRQRPHPIKKAHDRA